MAISSISNTISTNTIGITKENNQIPITKKVKELDDINVFNMKEEKVLKEDLIQAIESANKEFIIYDRRFEFSIHEKTNQIMVKVIDVYNDEIIREIPPEKILDMVACMWEIAGIIVDKRI